MIFVRAQNLPAENSSNTLKHYFGTNKKVYFLKKATLFIEVIMSSFTTPRFGLSTALNNVVVTTLYNNECKMLQKLYMQVVS